MSPSCEKPVAPKRRNKKAIRPQLLTRASLDRRTNAYRAFDSIARSIANDLGGEDQLTAIQRHLIEGFAGVAVTVQDLNARKAMGEAIDVAKLSVAVSSMVRIATRLGVNRVAKEIVDPLAYAAQRDAEREVAA
jgi:hypothetical protein